MQPPMPSLEGVRHRHVRVNGVELHVAEAGDPANRPVVLLHGWPQHWWSWRHQLAALAEHRWVLAVDLRGHGWSEAPRGAYRKDQLAADVIALAEELGLEEFDLAGHDWGGWVSTLVALERPDMVRRLFLASIALPWARTRPHTVRHLWRFWYQWLVATPFVGPAAIRAGMPRMLLGPWSGGTLDGGDGAIYVDVLRQPARARMSSRLYRTFGVRELPEVLAGAFNDRRLEVPTYLIFGTADVPLHPDLLDRDNPALASHAPNLEVEVVEGASHFILEERAELVTQRLLAFFAD